MKLAIVMIVAYLPFFWWMYKKAKEQLKKCKGQ
jgi:hypothetical protein